MYEYNKWMNPQIYDYVWPNSRTFKGNPFCTKAFLIGTIYFSLVSVVLAASPANLLPDISVSNNAIFQQDYST